MRLRLDGNLFVRSPHVDDDKLYRFISIVEILTEFEDDVHPVAKIEIRAGARGGGPEDCGPLVSAAGKEEA